MARRFAVVNQKGGVGKTTTVVNLAAALAKMNKRVLVVDYDHSAAGATTFLGQHGVADGEGGFSTAEFTLGQGRWSVCRDVHVPGLDLLPSSWRLANIEKELLSDVLAGTRKLATALDGVDSQYDVILIDCVPSLGMLAVAAMAAGPEIIIPVRLEPASLLPALYLFRDITGLRERGVGPLRVFGVLGTFFNATANTPKKTLGDLKDIFGEAVFGTVIHTAQTLADAVGGGVPTVLAAPSSRAAKEYMDLAKEIVSRG